MKNSNTPAMPLTGDAYTDFAYYDETKNTSYNPQCQGLTKREHFAGLAMQGMLASNYSGEFMREINDNTYDEPNGLANNAVRYVDALLEQLGE